MSIDKKYIKDTFLNLYDTSIKREGAADMRQWLIESDFFDAPCSTRFHLSEPGGLARHSIHVYQRLSSLIKADVKLRHMEEIKNNQPFDIGYTVGVESVCLVSLLHDVCKVNFYVPEEKNIKTYDPDMLAALPESSIKFDASGKKYAWTTVTGYKVEDQYPFGHGEKSVDIIRDFMTLSSEEKMAIRWHMGFTDNEFKAGGLSVTNAFEKSPLAVLLHVADLEATYLDET